LVFNQLEERKPISSLVNFALIDQNSIQSQSQSLVWYGLKNSIGWCFWTQLWEAGEDAGVTYSLYGGFLK